MRRGVGPCHTNNTTSQPQRRTENGGSPTTEQLREPSYAVRRCKTCVLPTAPPRIIRERPSTPRLCLCHVGAIGCHWETRRGMGLRQATAPGTVPFVTRLGLVCRARSLRMAGHVHPSAWRRASLSLLCLLAGVPGLAWPCSSRRTKRPPGRYPSRFSSPVSRPLSSPLASFPSQPSPMLPAGPRLQWLPDLPDMGPDWGIWGALDP
ncbi:hypothetical protein QBC39DRAFT_342079 [Podospora conica]|nr:hypothetical protein QBC39DRAFT_342079 [Schizothecium conicum]